MYKTIILDLDGTLLSSDKTVSEKNKKAINDCIKEGINVSIASGRPPNDVYPYVDILGLHDFYHVADNGATIFKHGSHKINDYKFDEETYKNLIEALRENNIEFGLLSPKSDYCVHEGGAIFAEVVKLIPDIIIENIGSDGVDKLENVYKVCAFYNNEKEYNIIRDLEKKYPIDAFNVADRCFDIMPRGVNKFTGAKALEKYTGVSTDEMIAMGDYENDKDILSNIGFGICMKNGLDSVKKSADLVLDRTNDEDAVAYVIDKYILRRI